MNSPQSLRCWSWLIAGLLSAWCGTTSAQAEVVDEPIGARNSLGLTLWHLGHDPNAVRKFHAFLSERKIDPMSLLPAGAGEVDSESCRVLVDPERLPVEQRNG